MRLVKMSGTKPLKLETTEGIFFVCQCGLSKKFPQCNGNHKRVKDEKEGKIYIYDENSRVEL